MTPIMNASWCVFQMVSSGVTEPAHRTSGEHSQLLGSLVVNSLAKYSITSHITGSWDDFPALFLLKQDLPAKSSKYGTLWPTSFPYLFRLNNAVWRRTTMPLQLDHTIVSAYDKVKSAEFIARMFGLKYEGLLGALRASQGQRHIDAGLR